MSVLVTGAAGFIGSHLSEHLLAKGEEVVGLDSFDPFYDRSIKLRNVASARDNTKYSLIESDIRDAEALDSLPDGVDSVVHLAALAGVRPSIAEPVRYASVNVIGTCEVLEWARQRGISRVVFASSSSVYGNYPEVPFREDATVDRPISPYAATKVAGELTCHTFHHLHDLSVIALRLFTVYGPRQRPDLAIHKFARLLLGRRPIPVFGDGTTARDYTYVDDIIQGISGALDLLRCSEPLFEIVNLGESQPVVLREMISVLGEEIGVKPNLEALPMQPGDVQRTYADVSKARRLLGYDPQTPFREGVHRFIRWLEADVRADSR